jgi:hypothetical protein
MSVSPLPVPAAAAATLIKLENGEYTAASVAVDPVEATKLGLVKEPDGNYGTPPPAPVPAEEPATVKSSPAVLNTLASLKVGGE